jgi:hypothetical protein
MDFDDEYRDSLQHAVEYVHVVASRRGFDTRRLVVAIDAGREPGIHWEHSLSVAVRDTAITVAAEGIPHDWIEVGTGFIDPRFSHRVTTLLAELEKVWVDGKAST